MSHPVTYIATLFFSTLLILLESIHFGKAKFVKKLKYEYKIVNEISEIFYRCVSTSVSESYHIRSVALTLGAEASTGRCQKKKIHFSSYVFGNSAEHFYPAKRRLKT